MISAIQSSPCSNLHPRLKRAGLYCASSNIIKIKLSFKYLKKIAGSDCSSEVSSVSINMQNTLQAGNDGSRLNNNNNKRNITNSMNIDTRQLYDPDSLWKRNKYR